MKYAVTALEMKQIDDTTINDIGIDALILMERAALKVADCVNSLCSSLKSTQKEREKKILAVCGVGNNGGDGIAAARILETRGFSCVIYLIGDKKKATAQVKKQLEIAENLGLEIKTEYPKESFDVIIDALFGIGLCRAVTLEYANLIEKINAGNSKVVSVDIPSGIDANTGKVLGTAVYADYTVTFGMCKLGMCLYPGAAYVNHILIEEIGFPKQVIKQVCSALTYRYFEPQDIEKKLPKRNPYSNKGSYGKVLIAAGSKQMTGAAYLSAAAAYRIGAGLVKVLTSKEAVLVLQTKLPETLTALWGEEEIKKAADWADVAVIGPGMGTDKQAQQWLKLLLENLSMPSIIDADAINILSIWLDREKKQTKQERIQYLTELLPKQVVLTPHLKELARLLDCSVSEISQDLIDIASECTYNNELVFVIKDARTIVASAKGRYINLSGNHGMATGGSGDVLTGIIAGLIAGGLSIDEAAELGVYLHGRAGDFAAKQLGHRSMLASDIITGLMEAILNIDEIV